MNTTKPKVYLIAYTQVADAEQEGHNLYSYLHDVGAPDWETDAQSGGEALAEVAGRLCYRSWAPGLNQNVTKVREGNQQYLANILSSRHTSVMAHVNITFIFRHVSRVFTEELHRHAVGTANTGQSQESLRFVRLDGEAPMVLPTELEAMLADTKGDPGIEAIQDDAHSLKAVLASLLRNISVAFKLDDPGTKFGLKKAVTSAMRRFVGMGIATDLMWTCNVRALRHVIEMRTDPAAEWEIREVFDQVAGYCKKLYPNLFQDFIRLRDGSWTTKSRAKALELIHALETGGPDHETLIDDDTLAVEYSDLVNRKKGALKAVVPIEWLEEWADRMKGNA